MTRTLVTAAEPERHDIHQRIAWAMRLVMRRALWLEFTRPWAPRYIDREYTVRIPF